VVADPAEEDAYVRPLEQAGYRLVIREPAVPRPAQGWPGRPGTLRAHQAPARRPGLDLHAAVRRRQGRGGRGDHAAGW